MDETGASSGTSWDSVFKQIATYGLTAAIDSEFIQPFQLERDKALAQDQYGRLYARGVPSGAPLTTTAGKMPAWLPWVLGGAAVLAVAVFLVKD